MNAVMAALVLTLFLNASLFGNWDRAVAQEVGCSLNMNQDLPKKNQPLMLKKSSAKDYSLALPTVKGREGIIELKKGEQLVLACPGKGNFLIRTKSNATTGSCDHDNQLNLGGDVAIRSVEAECKMPSSADVASVRTKCGGTGDSYQIGFQAEGWHPMVQVCFHVESSNTLYTEHTVIGAALRGAEQESDRPQFSEGVKGELYSFNPNNFYKKTYQKKYFEDIFGKNKSADYFNDDAKFLTRGHLSPDGDFLFGSWQFATYFYINAAPQWSQINSKNWLNVEKSVRSLGTKLKKDLKIITGTYGVLSFEDDNGKMRELYLNLKEKKLPVPEFFWKVVVDKDTKSGIAIVTCNNPNIDIKNVKYICQDIDCKKYKWLNTPSSTSTGFTYCCTIDNFRKSVKFAPNVKVEDVLYGPLK